MADLAELLERVKAATGPDRVIDALVAKALLSEAHPRLDPNERLCVRGDLSQPLCFHRPEPMSAVMRRRKEADGAEVLEFQDARGWWLFVSRCVPPVSASLDAALALVERVLPGADWRLQTAADGREGFWAVLIHLQGRNMKEGPTAPLALLAALLSALIAQPASGDVGSPSLSGETN